MNRVPLDVIREDVRALKAYPVPDAAGLVKLDMMENPHVLPEALARGLGERLGKVALNRYPPGDPAPFKRRLAQWAGLPATHALVLGNGSDELIHLLLQACARAGATVLSPWPSFSMYRMSAALERCGFVPVALRPDFDIDLPAALEAIARERPAVVFLSYPNNPTGNLFSREAIEQILRAAPGLVVVDEAYYPFAHASWMPALSRWPNLLVLRTVSKLGLAGLRLGYLCAAPELAAEIDKVRPPFNVNVLTMAAVDFLLDHLDVLDAQAAQVCEERERLAPALRAIGGVQAFASSANFVLLRVADAPGVFDRLLQHGILVKDVSTMDALLHNCLRVTVGTRRENDQFLGALRASL